MTPLDRSLLPAALHHFASLLEATDTDDLLRTVRPDGMRRDLLLYRQDLRTITRRLTDDDLIEISEHFPERSAEILALAGDVVVRIEDCPDAASFAVEDAARLGVALVKLGAALVQGAELVGVTLPPTVFLGRRSTQPGAGSPDLPQPTRQRTIFRRVKDWLADIHALFVLMRDASKGRPFLFDAPDNLADPDLYPGEEPFGRRVFISFERSSLPVAESFENALRTVGLEPYRYEPEKAVAREAHRVDLAQFRAAYPGVAEEIVRTVRRSSAALFILSDKSMRSPFCEMEAFAAAVTYFPFSSGIYAVLVTPGVQVPSFLSGANVQRYKPGLEDLIARNLNDDIQQLASFRASAEERRLAMREKRA